MKRAIYWFRNDLRLTDNAAFSEASAKYDQLIPVFVFDHEISLVPYLEFDRLGPFRIKFLHESLEDLREQLSRSNSGLLIEAGDLTEVFTGLKERYNCSTVHCIQGFGTEEKEQEARLKQAGFEVNTTYDQTLYHPDDVTFPIENSPEVFTPFRKKLEKYSSIRTSLSTPRFESAVRPNESSSFPSILTLGAVEQDERSAFPFAGGRASGLKRLEHYLWSTDLIKKYKQTRNGLVGTDYSSKLSAWLALGCISAREVYHEIQAYEQERTKNSSTYWLIFELIWRDFFQFMLMKHGAKLFRLRGIQNRHKKWETSDQKINNWALGKTPNDFINANMNELRSTGYMSNRGRQVAASYLVNDLKCDWRYGAAYFESQLIDYDVASNYGNWQYIAGVGNDPRSDRYFNPEGQAERYDPACTYRNKWLR